jgi:cytochrome P450
MAQSAGNPSLAPIPSHVPAHLVLDFDFTADPSFDPDPYAGMAKLAREAPAIFYTPRNGGHWIVSQHQAAFDIARNTEVFSNSLGPPNMLPISLDPPDHGLYRSVLVSAFAPAKVAKLDVAMRALANELIDAVAAKGRCEFQSAVAEPLPVLIFMDLVGLPRKHFRDLREWVVGAMKEGDQEKAQIYYQKMAEVSAEVIRDHQKQPKEDLISTLLASQINGKPLTFDEVLSYCLLLITAGLDTVINGMCLAVRHLAQDHPLQEKLRRDPSGIPELIEEMLRRYALTAARRRVRRDHEYAGIAFRTGDAVLLLYQGINLDPRAYPEPERLILDRKEPPVGFGLGPHRCVGSHLARFELKVLYEEWLRRIPTFRLDPDDPPVIHGGNVMDVVRLPLLWNASEVRN